MSAQKEEYGLTLRKRRNHRWTEDELDIIRRDYRHTNKSARDIANRLGATRYAVLGQCERMGLIKATDYRRKAWTEKEDEFLRTNLEVRGISYLARKLGRSINSVTVRSQRLKLHRRFRDGWYTKREVCEIVGHDHKWVQARIDCGALRATRHGDLEPKQCGMSMWHINEDDLRSFIRRYPQELIGCNIDIITIVDMLAGLT